MEHKSSASRAASKQFLSGLPVSVTSPVDIGRLIRELEQLDEAITQLGLRNGGTEVKLPKTSHLMDQLVELNKVNLLQPAERQHLLTFLQSVKTASPVLHISFSADPSVAFIEKMIAWLRKEIHPLVLMTVGMQPNIGAGCVVRSTNKQFDFSLRQDFLAKRDMLREQINAVRTKPTDAPAVPKPINVEGETELPISGQVSKVSA